jgi:predicted DNA-binding protein YlxM (UPF0122 family)
MEINISQDEIKDYLKLKTLSQLSSYKEKIGLYEKKYDMNFPQFEKEVQQGEEKFEMWDDYIEWKAMEGLARDLTKRLGEIDSARHIKITK